MALTHNEIQNAAIATAGAFIVIDELFLFGIGAKLHHGQIPIYRFGGHRESGESGWQCAKREVHEETQLEITPLKPSTTYLLPDGDQPKSELETIRWQHSTDSTPAPLLVVAYQRDGEKILSLMYQVQANGRPKPSSELQGIIYLKQEELHQLCKEPMTLGQFLANDGKAALNLKFDNSLYLEPFLQVKLLSRILLNS
jgi:hypothetical protein